MADESNIGGQNAVLENTQVPENEPKKNNENLQDFIMTEYNRQMAEGSMDPSDEIDEERTRNFFNKALAASQRMNKDIADSQKRMNRLHAEFSKERFDAWRHEHASEVLLPHEVEAVHLASREDHTQT